jgi:hypothetical protein
MQAICNDPDEQKALMHNCEKLLKCEDLEKAYKELYDLYHIHELKVIYEP